MRKFWLYLLLIFSPGLLSAQQLNIVQAQAPQTVPFAQPFTAQYQLSYTPGYQVTVDESSIPADFALQQVQATPSSSDAITYDFTLIPFTLGKSTFTVSFQLSQQDKVVSQLPAPLYVEVTPVKTFQDKKLREIRPPFIVRNWVPWLLALLILIALIYVICQWRKRLKAMDPLHISQQEDTRPSHVIALSKIDALLQSGLWENHQYKIFYITLVDILREYLQRRFNIDVSAETSTELLAHIKTNANLTSFTFILREFLTACDLIKFAKTIPSEQQRNQHIGILRSFVEQTFPPATITVVEVCRQEGNK